MLHQFLLAIRKLTHDRLIIYYVTYQVDTKEICASRHQWMFWSWKSTLIELSREL